MVVQPDGSLRSTPFHVRFGKFQLLKSDGANVIVTVNGNKTDFKMKVGQDGKVYFEKEIYIVDNNEDSSKNKDQSSVLKLKFIELNIKDSKIIGDLLKWGKNDVKFQIEGTDQFLVAQIYLWKHSTKLIISDIDGTVTKSDVLGHILPRIGVHDWSQTGIA